MSISNELSRISNNVSNALDAIERKGVTVPSGSNSDDLEELIDQIETGSAGVILITDNLDENGGTVRNIDATNATVVDTIDSNGGTVRTITGAEVFLQEKSATPTESAQNIVPDEGYTALSNVRIGAISSSYIGSAITRRSSTDVTVSGATITTPAGYYSNEVNKSVAIGATGTPVATKSSVSNHSVTISPSVTNTTGYITGGTLYGTAVAVSALELVSGTYTVSESGTADVTNYASISVPSGGGLVDYGYWYETEDGVRKWKIRPYFVTIQGGWLAGSQYIYGNNLVLNAIPSNTTITPTTSSQTIGGENYMMEDAITIAAMPSGTAGTPTATKSSVSNHSVTVTPSVTNVTGYITGGTKTGTAVSVSASELVSGNKALVANGTNIDVTNYATVSVAVPSDQLPAQEKSTSPTESQQIITPDSGYVLSQVTVGAISSTYVGTGIARKSSSDLTASGATVTVPAGYYSAQATKSVSSMTLPSSASSTSSGTSKATITPSTSAQYLNIPTGYNATAQYYTISAMPAMILPTSASSSATSGYTSKATISRSTSDQYINIPVGYNSAGAYYKIDAVSNMTLPTSASSTSSGTLKATISRSTSNQYINIPVGYNTTASYYTISAVPNGSATGPTSLSSSSATVSTGTNTLTLTKTGVTTTPTVSAGYVSSATVSTATVTLTASVTTKAATTYTPSTSTQTIAANQYLTGIQTINPIPSEYIIPSGTKTITANGTGIDVTSYAAVDVSVQSGEGTTAVASDIRKGKTALVASGLVTGTAELVYNSTTEELHVPDWMVDLTQGAEPNDVTFYDYDGSIWASYTAAEINTLTELPPNPQHSRLISQGWNWTLAQIKSQLLAMPGAPVNVGQMYITESGVTEIDIELIAPRLSPYLRFAVNGNVQVDWGDGSELDIVTGTTLTSTKNIQHIYFTEGKYTIKIILVSGSFTFYGSSTYTILHNNSGTSNANRVYSSCINNIYLGKGITTLQAYAFNYCENLKTITIPNTITLLDGGNIWGYCRNLRTLVIPNSVTSIANSFVTNCMCLQNILLPGTITSMGTNLFYYNYALSSLTIPSTVEIINTYAFYYCYCLRSIYLPNIIEIGNYAFYYSYSLPSLTIPSTVTSIGNSAFASCYGMKEYHLKPTTPPTLGTNAFNGIQSDCIIYVPYSADHSILAAYQSATNWSEYAAYMQEEPQ